MRLILSGLPFRGHQLDETLPSNLLCLLPSNPHYNDVGLVEAMLDNFLQFGRSHVLVKIVGAMMRLAKMFDSYLHTSDSHR